MQRASVDENKHVDLHIHTIHSDGTLSVREIFELACQKGVAALSITDHDCIDAYPAAFELGEQYGIEVLTGVELSSDIEGIDIHVLGYGFDIHNTAFNARLAQMKRARHLRARKIVRNLNKQGIDLRFETVLKLAGDAAIGRPHIASAMLKEELIYSFREAFDRYIGYESPAYVEKMRLHPKEVFDMIKAAGGIAVIAHPGATKVDERIAEFVKDGVDGIEVYHPEHSGSLERYYKKLGHKYNLVLTGGSDFHAGDHSKVELGSLKTPFSVVQEIRDRCAANAHYEPGSDTNTAPQEPPKAAA